MNNKNQKKPTSVFLVVISIFAVSVAVITIYYYFINFNKGYELSDNPEVWAWFGEYLGGILSATFAFAALIALLYSIHLQSIELRNSTEQLEKSAKALEQQNELIQKQKIEGTFLELLKLHIAVLENLHITTTKLDRNTGMQIDDIRYGRKAISYLFSQIAHYLQQTEYKNVVNEHERIEMVNNAFESLYEKSEFITERYFRSIYIILNHIDKSSLEYTEKSQYTEIVKAFFSSDELNLLLYYSVSKYGERLLPHVQKYNLLEHQKITHLGVFLNSDDKLLISKLFKDNLINYDFNSNCG